MARQQHYQAVLLKGDNLLLTTFHNTDIKSFVQVQIPELPLGTIWDYYGQVPDTAWLAAPEKMQSSDVQMWLHQLARDAWYGPLHCQ